MKNTPITSKQINKAIKKYQLEIVHERGSGYSYFLDLNSGDQVGESIMVCHLNQLTLTEWVNEAIRARIAASYVDYNPEGSYEAAFEERFLETLAR